jgi:preprotein translocase subunit SecG
MEVVKTIVIVLEVLASVALIGIVLMQSGKEAGLSGAIAGNSDSYMSKSKNGGLDKKLASATKWVALAWIVLTLVISLLH